jgi:hypothetical protein
MSVETMIQDARRLADMNRRARVEDRDIEYRRQSALERISGAVQKRSLDLENPDMKRMLEDRILEAATGRISLAEAIADCAENLGDFNSPLIWWELKSKSNVTIWKGYVTARKSCRRIVHYTNRSGIAGLPDDAGEQICLSFLVRRDCFGKQICSCVAQGVNGIAVGIGETIRGAVVRSYVVFFNSLGRADVTDASVPESLLRDTDSPDDELEEDLDRRVRKG